MGKQIIVIGQLGELVKKIDELEHLAHAGPSQITTLQLAAYYKVLEAWPVADAAATQNSVAALRICAERYREAWGNFQASFGSDTPAQLVIWGTRYVETKTELGRLLKVLNAEGRFLGPVPTLELELE